MPSMTGGGSPKGMCAALDTRVYIFDGCCSTDPVTIELGRLTFGCRSVITGFSMPHSTVLSPARLQSGARSVESRKHVPGGS